MNKYSADQKSGKTNIKLRKSFYISAGIFLLLVLLFNIFQKEPSFRDIHEQLRYELDSDQPELAEKTYLKLISTDTANVGYHYYYISTHFEIPKEKTVDRYEVITRNDSLITAYYTHLSESADSVFSDLGLYGLGVIQVCLKDYDGALSYYLKVRNKDLPYLNNSIGFVYRKKGPIESAEKYFQKEIKNNGNLSGAYFNLIEILYNKKNYKQLRSLLKDPEARKYFSYGIERTVYFKNFDLVNYCRIIFKPVLDLTSIWGSLAALFIMIIWLVYVIKLDFFEPEKWQSVFLTLLLGMFFSFLTYFLSDINHLVFNFNLTGGLVNDFFYCVFGIGFIEELVKIIPLLLVLKYSRVINEPYDFMLYASVSALGFAFIENIMYFGSSSLQIIHSRALTATVAHMFFSSVAAYGFILNKVKEKGKGSVLTFFLLAALCHGFYDFWLINESVSDLHFLTIVFFIISLFIWMRLINHALNNSSFFDEQKIIDASRLQDYLVYSLSSVLMFEFAAIAINYGPAAANGSLLSSVYSGTYLIVFLSLSLSDLKLKQSETEKTSLKESEVNS